MFHWIYAHVINTIYFIPTLLVIFFVTVCVSWIYTVLKLDIGNIDEE
ncbi:hypothetical protein HFZ78_24140 [Priestia megaterium]|uniref:Uncharacterized protein n=1 Tax=Priestia megaterium TaxID=1404 RepID=A0A6H1P775_PRIMG|nr:hypothetical protein [Priestia megaterium]QIZ09393.1 hypothetical protein HFZ78_24140 [Priestia megaterium]